MLLRNVLARFSFHKGKNVDLNTAREWLDTRELIQMCTQGGGQ